MPMIIILRSRYIVIVIIIDGGATALSEVEIFYSPYPSGFN